MCDLAEREVDGFTKLPLTKGTKVISGQGIFSAKSGPEKSSFLMCPVSDFKF
jgi:hypothetical protein